MGPAGPPTTPAPGPDVAQPPRRRALWGLLAVLVALGMLATGLVVGQALEDDDLVDDLAEIGGEPVSTLGSSADPPILRERGSGGVELVEPDALVPEDEPEPVTAVAQVVAPSVVSIEIHQGGTPVAQGSGIVWEAGLIVTNAHVVQGADSVVVRFADGRETDGTVLGSDTARDVALVEIDSSIEVTPATFAPVSTVSVGQIAVAVGSPFSLEQTVTSGIVSAVGRAVESQPRVVVEMIQTDASINPGNSGGALADRQGRVVGMNTSIRTDGVSQGNVGVGFAVPSDTISLIVDRLLNGQSLETGYLGVYGESAATGEGGVVVTDVVPNEAADDGGLEIGDRIIGLNGERVGSMGSLAADVQLHNPGEVLEFTIVRDGEEIVLPIALGSLG